MHLDCHRDGQRGLLYFDSVASVSVFHMHDGGKNFHGLKKEEGHKYAAYTKYKFKDPRVLCLGRLGYESIFVGFEQFLATKWFSKAIDIVRRRRAPPSNVPGHQ